MPTCHDTSSCLSISTDGARQVDALLGGAAERFDTRRARLAEEQVGPTPELGVGDRWFFARCTVRCAVFGALRLVHSVCCTTLAALCLLI